MSATDCGCLKQAVTRLTDCVCPGPGFCERHECDKNEHFHRLCSTRPDYFALWEAGAGPCMGDGGKPGPVRLGDAVARFLQRLGITSERVSAWLGRDCGCKARQTSLNRLIVWGWWRA